MQRGREIGDPTRLRRRLGLAAEPSGAITAGMRYETALAIVEAIGRDPVDFGL